MSERKLPFLGKEIYDGGRVIEFDLTGMNSAIYCQQASRWPDDARLHL